MFYHNDYLDVYRDISFVKYNNKLGELTIMAKEKVVEYNDIKGHLKETFDAFVADATKFGVDAETAHEIAGMSHLKAKGLWLLFKKQFKIKLAELELHDLADTLIGDLEEDHVSVASLDTLERILENPSDERYMLEEDMIAQIEKMSHQQKDLLRDQVSQSLHLGDLSAHEEHGTGHKILSFLKGLWIKMAPVLDKIFDVVVGIGAESLKDVVEKGVGNEVLAEALQGAIDDTTKIVQNLNLQEEEKELVGADAEVVGDL